MNSDSGVNRFKEEHLDYLWNERTFKIMDYSNFKT